MQNNFKLAPLDTKLAMSNLSIRSSDTVSIESDNESSNLEDDLPDDIFEAAEIAGNDDNVPCSPPPPYDYVLEEQVRSRAFK